MPPRGTRTKALSAVTQFAADVRASGQVAGFNEETLTAPTRDLIGAMGALVGAGDLLVVDKSSVEVAGASVGVPDLSVYAKGLLRLVVELKAPGKGADPRAFKGRHDQVQWQRYSQLPNIVYTDGNTWTLWRAGDLHGPPLGVCADLTDPSEPVAPDAQKVLRFFGDALAWTPPAITSTRQLARQTALRCRALRADVGALPGETLASLTRDWRDVLFPELDDGQFVDAYAQTVAFALLAASGLGIELSLDVDPKRYDRLGLLLHHVAETLGAARGVLGKALALLTTDPQVRSQVAASLDSMVALAAALDWTAIRSSGGSDDWMDFYETFLADYDPELRKLSGSYYTPRPVVEWMTRFTDRTLVDLFDLPDGYANPNVTVVDPALGTGTYLVGVLDRIADAVTVRVGPGQAAAAMNAALAGRVIGFESQACPYAVAQLRLVESLKARDPNLTPAEPAIYLTDTLADPDAGAGQQMLFMKPITESRERADEIKRETPVKVVIGNPPYRVGAPQTSWVAKEMLDDWKTPTEWGVSAHTRNMSNLYVYFWRWAAWKVFENSGGDEGEQAGIVSFITPTGWLDGDGFQQMRAWLNKWCSHMWILDLSPEGLHAPSRTQVFEAMRQPVAVVTAVRVPGHQTSSEVRYHKVPAGDRYSKFAHIADLVTLDDARWEPITQGPLGARSPLTPPASQAWQQMPSIEDLLPWNAKAMMIGRTWPVAPDPDILQKRWEKLLAQQDDAEMSRYLKEHKPDCTIHKELTDNLTAACREPGPLKNRQPSTAQVVEYGYRSFDRQYVIRDKRLINRPNPSLWAAHSDNQIHLAAPALGTANKRPKIAASTGQIVSFSAHIPDMDHLDGRGGPTHPLWRDPEAASANTDTATLTYLATVYGRQVTGPDVFAYIAAVAAHPGFTDTFRDELVNAKTMRVPLTNDPALFDNAVRLGRRILYLSTFGKRCAPPDVSSGCPRPPEKGPSVETPIPTQAESLTHDPHTETLTVSGHSKRTAAVGTIANVSADVFAYSTATINVLESWFKYRRHNPGGKKTSPLDNKVPASWQPHYTDDLIDLLNVLALLVAERPAQQTLLDNVLAGAQITRDHLSSAGALPAITGFRAKPSEFKPNQPTLSI